MDQIIAVHQRPGFAERWLERCRELGIQARPVRGHSTSIVSDLRDCSALLWHLSQDSLQELEFSRSVLFAAETAGLTVFPNVSTAIHFNDKVAQKYLLEAAGAPLVPTWVFFSEAQALDWAAGTSYPKVFKLRRGAASANVRLVRSEAEARRLIRTMFRGGLTPVVGAGAQLRRGIRKVDGARRRLDLLARLPRYAKGYLKARSRFGRERDYAYFQEFVPDNSYDIRVTVIGDRAFFYRRRVRPRDFRASGSGLVDYPAPDRHDLEAVRVALDLSARLGFQSMAFDFVVDRLSGSVALLEISYVFNAQLVHDCPGHFDAHMLWHEGNTWPQDAILEDVLQALESR